MSKKETDEVTLAKTLTTVFSGTQVGPDQGQNQPTLCCCFRNLRVSETSGFRNLRLQEPQAFGTSGFRNLRLSEPQGLGTSGLRNLRLQEPQGSGTKRHSRNTF